MTSFHRFFFVIGLVFFHLQTPLLAEITELPIPAYCQHYENPHQLERLAQAPSSTELEQQLSQVIYEFPEAEAQLRLRDLLRYRVELKNYRVREHRQQFQNKLLHWISYLNIESKRGFYLSFDLADLQWQEEELEACMAQQLPSALAVRNKEIRSQAPQQDAFELFLIDSLPGAIALGSLLQKQQYLTEQLEHEKKAILRELSVAKLMEQGLLGSANTAKPTGRAEHLAQALTQLQDLEQAQQQEFRIQTYELYQRYPLFFEFQVQPQIFNFLHTNLHPSDFFYRFNEKIDVDIRRDLQRLYALDPHPHRLLDLLQAPELQSYLEDFFAATGADKSLQKVATQSAKKNLRLRIRHSLKLCLEEDPPLFHNALLVENVLQKNTSSHLFKEMTVKDQAAYCSLLKDEKKQQQSFLRNTDVYGFAAIAGGAISQFITGRAALAHRLFATGAGLWGFASYQDYQRNEAMLHSTHSLVSQSFVGSEKYHEYLNRRGEILSSLLVDLGLSVTAVGSLRSLDQRWMREIVASFRSDRPPASNLWFPLDKVVRGKSLQALLQEGSLSARQSYLALQQQRQAFYDRMAWRFRTNSYLKSLRAKLGRLNLNYDWPAYALYFHKQSHIDPLLVVLNRDLQKTLEGQEKLAQLKQKLSQAENATQILLRKVDDAFNAESLLPKYERVFKSLRDSDFEEGRNIEKIAGIAGARMNNGRLHLRFRSFRDGKRRWTPARVDLEAVDREPQWTSFVSLNELKFEITRLRYQRHQAIPNSIYQEWGGSSELVKELYAQAVDHRLYTVVMRKLEALKDSRGLNADEQEIYQALNKLLLHQPRVEQQTRLLLRELPLELFDASLRLVPFLRSRIIGKGSDVASLDPTHHVMPRISRIYELSQWGVGLSISTMAFPVYVALTENGSWYHRFTEKLYLQYNDLVREFSQDGATYKEIQCAKEIEERNFRICYRQLTFEEIGYQWALGIRDRRPFYKNLDLQDRVSEFAFQMVRLRKLYRVAEIRRILEDQMSQSLRDSFVMDLVDAVESQLPSNKQWERQSLRAVAFALLTATSPEELRYLVEKYRASLPDSVLRIFLEALRTKKVALEDYEESVSLPAALQEFIDKNRATDQEGLGTEWIDFFDLQLKKAFELQAYDEELEKSLQAEAVVAESQSSRTPLDPDIEQLLVEIERLWKN